MAKKKQIKRKPPNPLSLRVKKNDAVWLEGPVRAGFWQYPEHRRAYLIWLGQKLGFRKLEDFYRIKTEHFKKNRGSGALLHCWQSSAVAAVIDTFPDIDWKEWLFVSCPRAFWKSPKNHSRYMTWLARTMRHQSARRLVQDYESRLSHSQRRSVLAALSEHDLGSRQEALT
jgi:hypothetical protein